MADSILRLKVDSQEYDQKIKRAAEGIQQYAQKCREAGGTLQYLDDGVLEFVQALGKMDTVATGTKQQLREMSNALTTLTQTYRGLTDEEKASPFGQELAKGIQQLTERAGQAKDAMMDVEQSIKNAASDTRMFDQMAQGMSVAMAGFQGLTGAGKLLGIEMGNDVEVIAKLQAAMAVTNSLTTIQTALQKQSALMQGIQAAQAAAAAVAQGSLASATGVATVAQKAFNLVANANPYVLLGTAIAAVGSALWAFASTSSEAKKKEEELEKAMEDATKKAREQRDAFVNASASAMNTASRLSSLQVAYKNANSEMEKTSILKEAQKEFKNLGIECKGLVDAQNLLVNQGGQIIEMIRLQGDAAAIAALRMEAFKKSFSMLLENGYDANGAAILAGYNAQVQDLDGQLTKIQTRIQTIKGGLPTSGGAGGSRNTNHSKAETEAPPISGSIDEQTAKVQELQKAWRAAADDDSRLKIKKEIEEQQYILDRMTGKETFDPSKLNILPDIDAQKAKVEELLKAWEALANDDSRQKIKRDLEEAQAELDRMTKQKTVGITYDVSMPDVDAQTAKVDELRKAWEAVANDDSRQKIKREMEEAQDTLDRMTKQKAIGITYDVSMPDVDAQKAKVEELRKAWEALANDESRQKIKRDLEKAQAELDRMTTQKAIGITYDVSMPDVDAQKAKVEELRKAWEALANDESRQKIKRDLEEAQAELDRMTTQKAIGITYDVSMPDVDAQTAKVEELRKAWEAVANDDSRQKIKRDLEEAQAELDRMTANVKSLKGVSIVPEIKMEDPLKRAQETLKTTRVEIEAEIKADATKVDTATLHTLLKDAIQSGIDDGLMNMTFANISDRVARGINVPDEAWQKILDQYNALREKIGMEPISLDFKTGNIDNSTKEKSSSSSLASSQKLVSGLSSVSSGLQQMGVKLPDGVQKVLGGIQGLMTVIQGVQSIISIFNTTTATAQTLTTNTNTAAMTALTSAVVANTAAITTNTITPSFFAGGGVVHAASGYVGGSHFSGDLVPALLNSGELVLNRAQQGVLASQLEGVGMGNIELKAVVSGEQLLLVQNNRGLRTGRGEIVQSRRMR